jgi:hypothetical protein
MRATTVLRGTQFRGFVPPIKSVWIVVLGVLAMSLVMLGTSASQSSSPSSRTEKIPVVFDTDIGDDIDDTWALALLLQSPEFDVKLVTTAVNNTRSKAKIVAKFLETVGRTDIPVGIGVQQNNNNHRQEEWTKDYDLRRRRSGLD